MSPLLEKQIRKASRVLAALLFLIESATFGRPEPAGHLTSAGCYLLFPTKEVRTICCIPCFISKPISETNSLS
jgi:hypothetical protein